MISNILETLGFAFVVLAAYEFSGRVAAFIALGVILLFVGFTLDGVTVKVPQVKIPWPKHAKRKLKMVDEPLTNREMDLLEQAQR